MSRRERVTAPVDQPETPDLVDIRAPRPVSATRTVFDGAIWDVREDEVDLGPAGQVVRQYVEHPGAVAVLALDEHDRVVVIQQYRHPVRMLEWELPAGLLDVDGEPAHVGAARELYEEADLRARRWDVLIDYFSSPGGLDEALRIYLARDLTPVPEAERFVREAEELGMPTRHVPLGELVDAVFAGRLHNPTLVIGVLAAAASRDRGFRDLRSVDSPWSTHPRPIVS